VKIILIKGSTQVATIKDSTSIGSGGKGSYYWPVPTNAMTGSDFRILVKSISQPTLMDWSNNYISLS
jgi:hypothetical protein